MISTLPPCAPLQVVKLDGQPSRRPQLGAKASDDPCAATALTPSAAASRSEQPAWPPRSIAPRDVRLAIDYIDAHLNTGFRIVDLIAATGVAERTLFKHFKDFKGVSPMSYACSARYLKARRALQNAGPEEGVTEIAMRSGFTHMGRFSVGYRRRFGESPSQTLKRREHT